MQRHVNAGGRSTREGELTLRMTALLLAAFVLAGCAHTPPPEPPSGRQLWEEKACFAHERPAWRHLDLRELGGIVKTGRTGGRQPYPDAVVYARRWAHGPVIQTTTKEDGSFLSAS